MSKRLRPKKWQTELIDQVTWCSMKTRTKPPHSRAVSAVPMPPPIDPAERERDREPEHHPDAEQLVHDSDQAVLDEVGGEPLALGGADGLEQPADVRVPQSLDGADEARATEVRRVRVALLVGERVVLAVVGDPGDDRALDRHRAAAPR